jgi:hypothetical protein
MISLVNLLRLWRGKNIKSLPVRVLPGATAHDLAVTCIVKNEANYLEEWITFHCAQGVSHFFIYDNESTDRSADILAPFVASGLVTLARWPHVKGYHASARAFAHALSSYGAQCRWMAFIDADEFLYCPDGTKLPALLQGMASCPALIVHRHTYGTSGHLTPPGGLIRHFNRRMPAPEGCFEMTSFLAPKSVVQPAHVVGVNGPHFFMLRGSKAIGQDETGEMLTGRHAPAFRADVVRINHYYTKDRQSFLTRISRGRAGNTVVPESKWLSLFEHVEARATVRDDGILSLLKPEGPH